LQFTPIPIFVISLPRLPSFLIVISHIYSVTLTVLGFNKEEGTIVIIFYLIFVISLPRSPRFFIVTSDIYSVTLLVHTPYVHAIVIVKTKPNI